eukprot:1970738-Amphidinium_carterae.1
MSKTAAEDGDESMLCNHTSAKSLCKLSLSASSVKSKERKSGSKSGNHAVLCHSAWAMHTRAPISVAPEPSTYKTQFRLMTRAHRATIVDTDS